MPPLLLSEENGAYVIESLRKEGVLAAFSSRKWNLKLESGKSPADSKDRRDFCRALGVQADQLVCLEQVHGTGIALLGDSPRGDCPQIIPKTDAVMTKRPGMPFAVHTADCAPVFFFDPEARAAGLAHIGWKGAQAGLAVKMVEAFHANLNSRARDLKVVLGPMIGACCYEVGAEFEQYFPGFVQKRGKQNFFDLKGFIKSELVKAGLLAVRLEDVGLCTVCEHSKFFSYRHEKDAAGRICSVMMIQ